MFLLNLQARWRTEETQRQTISRVRKKVKMRGAQEVMVAMVVAAAAGVAWTNVAVYRAQEGVGSCGSGFLDTPVLSDTLCAIKCSQSEYGRDRNNL